MNLFESFKLSIHALSSNKLRSSLSILGIMMGNASVIVMISLTQSAQQLAKDQFESLGPNLLFIFPGSTPTKRLDLPNTLTWDDAKAIASQVPAIKDVTAEINSREKIIYRGDNISTRVWGVSPEFLVVRNFAIDKGRFINNLDMKRNSNIVILGSHLARQLFGNDNLLNKNIRIKGTNFRVVGIIKSKGVLMGINYDEIAFIPITTMAYRLRGKTSAYGLTVNVISVTAKNQDSIRAAKFQIENLLRIRHNITDEDDFVVNSQSSIVSIIDNIAQGLMLLLIAISTISLLIAGIGIMNIMLMSVTERTSEIGLRKAIGATQKDILQEFLIEAIILSLMGGIIGTTIGISGILLIGILTPLPTSISFISIILPLIISATIGLCSGVFPAYKAAKLDPIIALKTI